MHLSDVVGLALCGRALGMLINFNLLEQCPKSQRRQLAFCEVICKYPVPPLKFTMPCYYVISSVKGRCMFFTYLTFFLGPYKAGCVCDSVSNISSRCSLLCTQYLIAIKKLTGSTYSMNQHHRIRLVQCLRTPSVESINRKQGWGDGLPKDKDLSWNQ